MCPRASRKRLLFRPGEELHRGKEQNQRACDDQCDLEQHGDLVRLRAGVRDGGPAWAEGLAADVTPAALLDLPAEPGAEVWFAVKATEVTIHPAGRPA